MIIRQQGYTLMELLIIIAITGIIFTIVGPAIYQISTVTDFSTDKLTANHELQNAAFWFNMDGQTAVSAVGSSTLTLSLPSGQTITYSLAGNNLTRSTGASTTILAQNISSLVFTVRGRLVSMNITSSPSGGTNVSEQNVYQVYLRSTL